MKKHALSGNFVLQKRESSSAEIVTDIAGPLDRRRWRQLGARLTTFTSGHGRYLFGSARRTARGRLVRSRRRIGSKRRCRLGRW